MSAPYPHPNPVPGSNAIGSFTIGVSPIGDIPAFDYWVTVIAQYANSPILTQLISNFFQYIDPTTNLANFFDLIWNVSTAQGYGLDVWGRIVGVTRTLNLPTSGRYLGFEEQSITVDPFNQSPFYSGAALTTTFQLSDAAFQTLIFAKALSNISNGTIQSINQILLNLFPGRGNCYVVDGNGTSASITGVAAGVGNVIQLTLGAGDQNSVAGFSSGAGVVVKGVGGVIEANGNFFIDVVQIGSGAYRVNLRNTNLVHSYTSGGTLSFPGNGLMTMEYVFNFALTSVEAAIVTQSGVLPKPTGVSATVVQSVL
jgi:Protein of unknown function (DUF2612)